MGKEKTSKELKNMEEISNYFFQELDQNELMSKNQW